MIEILKGLTAKAIICRNFRELEYVLIVLLTIFKIILKKSAIFLDWHVLVSMIL